MTAENGGPALTGAEIAIIGMSGRFPGARGLEAYWRVIAAGAETIATFTDEELRATGVDPRLLRHPQYIKRRGVLDDVETFDAGFFGYNPREALFMDPQQRLFLQAAWEALEHAGCNPQTTDALIGVYAGSSSSNWTTYLQAHRDALGDLDGGAVSIGNDLTFLPTRISYKLNLRGPSFPVQTACSTSLVAVHLACQGLLNAECDLALAGGVSIRLPQASGYVYQPDGIFSPDGHCRSFDARTRGTVFSNGLGVVVLKRLEDALADHDFIYAVIKGSAVNNDGSQRASFTAPGINGQTAVVADALANADVDPDTIGYVEGHGSGTLLGDSIEVQALTRAFERRGTSRRQFCALGSAKANIGHCDAAAGIAGLIKAVLALHHGQLPPLAQFEAVNPDLQLERTPFYINTELRAWPRTAGVPRRAGVSAFGFGGTNAHVVLEEAPSAAPTPPAQPWQLLLLSAETDEGAGQAAARLGAHLAAHPETNLADAASTLALGRRFFRARRALVARDTADAATVLATPDAPRLLAGRAEGPARPVLFLLPGQGAQYVNMGLELMQSEPVFRATVDRCAEHLRPALGLDLRSVLYPPEGESAAASARLTETMLTQAALFVVEYALARLLQHWGVQPQGCLGHSLGEYVAATLAGVFRLEDALELVALRGRLMQQMPAGVMTVVPRPAAEIEPRLTSGLWLSAINAPELCVVSGSPERIAEWEARLKAEGVECRRLHTSHAFHSGLMEAAVAPFVRAVGNVPRSAPQIPYVSNLTGRWITADQVLDPEYWGRHMRQPVRFADGVTELAAQSNALLVELGPGHTLTTLARAQLGPARGRDVLSTLRGPHETGSDRASVLGTLGRLWVAGARVDWQSVYGDQPRRRIPLPAYPFEKTRFWLEGPLQVPKLLKAARQRGDARSENIDEWLYAPAWRRELVNQPLNGEAADAARENWLLIGDAPGAATALAAELRGRHANAVIVNRAPVHRRSDARVWELDTSRAGELQRLFGELRGAGLSPDRIVLLAGTAGEQAAGLQRLAQQPGVETLLALLQALSASGTTVPSQLTVLTRGLFDVTGQEPLDAGLAILLGLCRVIPQEFPGLRCRVIDLEQQPAALPPKEVSSLARELLHAPPDAAVAYRGGYRWVEDFQPLPLASPGESRPVRLRPRGFYLITGGLGQIGLELARYLARSVQARLLLTARSPLPPAEEWDAYAAAHPGDARARRIGALREIEQAGGEVLVAAADAADARAMTAALAQAEQRFGALHGVIHAAGVIAADAFHPLADLNPQRIWRQLQPKVGGVHVLDELLRERGADFCLLVSSLSTILGGLNYGAYAAANAYLDSFVRRRHRAGDTRWLSVNLDNWRSDQDIAASERAGQFGHGYYHAASEGIEVLRRILHTDAGPQIVVSTGDLAVRYAQWVSAKQSAQPETAADSASQAFQQPRPNLATAFQAPGTPTEQKLAQIWQQLLGIDAVGVHDNFLELGGHSLMATQVLSRVREALGVQLPMRQLFESPTIAELAACIDSAVEAPETTTALEREEIAL